MTRRCLACGQEIRRRSSRVCGLCGRPILRHHKFTFNGSQIEHRVCAEPGNYVAGGAPAEEPVEQRALEVTT